jgi:hypothetical protein
MDLGVLMKRILMVIFLASIITSFLHLVCRQKYFFEGHTEIDGHDKICRAIKEQQRADGQA